MYNKPPSLVIGFHVCKEKTALKALNANQNILRTSENTYDWLGRGIYFWENSVERARQFGEDCKEWGRMENPTIIGAVIRLGHCLDLLDADGLKILKKSYDSLDSITKTSGVTLPKNTGFDENDPDTKKRELDCRVIEYLHTKVETKYDSVRAAFWEGECLYPNAGFREKNHIQIAVINPNCILGYFNPLSKISSFELP